MARNLHGTRGVQVDLSDVYSGLFEAGQRLDGHDTRLDEIDAALSNETWERLPGRPAWTDLPSLTAGGRIDPGADLTMGNRQVKDLADATNSQDAVSKRYAEANFARVSTGDNRLLLRRYGSYTEEFDVLSVIDVGPDLSPPLDPGAAHGLAAMRLLVPLTRGAIDLGAPGRRWRAVYADVSSPKQLSLETLTEGPMKAFTAGDVGPQTSPVTVGNNDIIAHNSITPSMTLEYNLGQYGRAYKNVWSQRTFARWIGFEGEVGFNAIAGQSDPGGVDVMRVTADGLFPIGAGRSLGDASDRFASAHVEGGLWAGQVTLGGGAAELLAFSSDDVAQHMLPPSATANYDIIAHNSLTPVADYAYNLGQFGRRYRNVYCGRLFGDTLAFSGEMTIKDAGASNAEGTVLARLSAAGIEPALGSSLTLGTAGSPFESVHARSMDLSVGAYIRSVECDQLSVDNSIALSASGIEPAAGSSLTLGSASSPFDSVHARSMDLSVGAYIGSVECDQLSVKNSFALNGNTITQVANPTQNTDVANKVYVDDAVNQRLLETATHRRVAMTLLSDFKQCHKALHMTRTSTSAYSTSVYIYGYDTIDVFAVDSFNLKVRLTQFDSTDGRAKATAEHDVLTFNNAGNYWTVSWTETKSANSNKIMVAVNATTFKSYEWIPDTVGTLSVFWPPMDVGDTAMYNF